MMKRQLMFFSILASPGLFAGISDAPASPPAASAPGDWLEPILDIRSRYEWADVAGFDASHAWTFRERLGLQTATWHGFRALLEGEFSQSLVDDYHGGAPGAEPFDPARSLIADPETNELNQAYLEYEREEISVRIGRQRIIHDNAAFIGNVGWRQNEQTFDALLLQSQALPDWSFDYAWLGQVNRIFGSEAKAPLAVSTNVSDVAASAHLLRASYTGREGLTLGGYAWIMNFPDLPAWDNNTFGIHAKGKIPADLLLSGEWAWQDKAGAAGDGQAFYLHASASRELGEAAGWNAGSLTLGLEHLDAGFKTPLATLHAFNGYADAFVGGRTNGSHNGLTNLYLSHTLPLPGGMKWSNTLHAMGDNELAAGYGWEIDTVLVKPFGDHLTVLAKLACFESRGDAYSGANPLQDTLRFSLECTWRY